MAKVRLTRKFAEMLNGIDLSHASVGQEIDLSRSDAELLIAEGWAQPIDTADDRPRRRSKRPHNDADGY